MKYAFLTCLIPKHLAQVVQKRSRHSMQDAANALQWNIYEGLCQNLDVPPKLLNVLPVSSFPQYYSRAFIHGQAFHAGNAVVNQNIGFCNIKLLRKYHQPCKIYKALIAWCKENNDCKTLFVYTVSASFMKAIAKMKVKFPNVCVVAIVADLPDMSSLSSRKTILRKVFEKRMANVSYSNIDAVDNFVLLTAQMADYMKITKPFCVMEGIAAPSSNVTAIQTEQSEKIVLYTGTLHRKFGVLNLLEAFKCIKDEKYRLWICGVGDSEKEIERAAKEDLRIVYKGRLPREEVLRLQSMATVLVNPRQNNEEFTKYSFPSKTMEYLASGVPVIAYKLDGIPDEYDSHINYVVDDSAEALAQKIVYLCEMPMHERREIGRKGQCFVLDNKNAVVQIKRVLEFLGNL